MSKVVLLNILCLSSLPALSDNSNYYNNNQWNEHGSNLVKYLQNLGGYLGYDVTHQPTDKEGRPISVNQDLLNIPTLSLAETYVFYTFLGALPMTANAPFIPSGVPGSNQFNKLANATFAYQQYSNPSTGGQKVTVNSLIDQQTYQEDPVSQAVLNILGTPNYTYCMLTDLSNYQANCKLLFQNQVMNNVIGDIPPPSTYFSYDYNQQLIGQLNINSLISPMLYTTEQQNQNTTGSPTPNPNNPGLTAQNQIQEAANFIRYASGGVAPGNLPTMQAYTDLYFKAVPSKGSNVSVQQQIQAQNTLNNYFANLRVYAAQSSVGVSNLYYILSKRMPQNPNKVDSAPVLTSQAVSEFNMATWRLFDPKMNTNKQWVEQLNGASSATVQKEIATLLAEINYQMYLDRQIQERILLTNSIMLIQNTRSGQPSSDFANQATSTSP